MNSLHACIQALLDDLVARAVERGIQCAVYLHGELVVDACSGYLDSSSGRPICSETLFPVFSTTKGIVATVIHRLVERGLLSYDAPIASVWPEFGANGKEAITLRQALNHSSGLPHMPGGIGYGEMSDWDKMCAAIAAMPPLWPPGSRIEYHPMTYGWIVGNVAVRVSGKAFSQLVQDEICTPLGIETLFVGMPARYDDRVAILEEPGAIEPVTAGLGETQTVPSWIGPLHAMMNRPDAGRACIPGSNGIMNAAAIARHYAALLPGGVDGVELLPPARVRLATQPEKLDPRRALGYHVGGEGALYGGPASFGHGGYGGSCGFADPVAGIAVGITKNLFHQEDTPRRIVEALRAAL